MAITTPAGASRCQGGITNGLQCKCPDFTALLNAGTVKCGNGFTPIVYDLDRPFAPDNTTSHLVMRGQPGSPCDGLVKDMPVRGQLVGCWGPLQHGCRVFRVPFNGVCLHVDPSPLGPPCVGDCANLTTEQVAIGTAGSASFVVCGPAAPTTSCRSTNPFGSELFRFQTGGLCDTYGCNAGTPNPNACVKDWGATYWGFTRPTTNPPGWYDWLSGGFKVTVKGNRATCNVYSQCLGSRGKNWQLVTVANPAAGYNAPCPDTPAAACAPATCATSTTTTTGTTTTGTTTTTVSTSTTSST